jgi:hypothetical protein
LLLVAVAVQVPQMVQGKAVVERVDFAQLLLQLAVAAHLKLDSLLLLV